MRALAPATTGLRPFTPCTAGNPARRYAERCRNSIKSHNSIAGSFSTKAGSCPAPQNPRAVTVCLPDCHVKAFAFPPVKRKCSCEHEPVRRGQLPLARRTIRSRISSECWEQIKTAYAAGIGLREIARKMNIPKSTALAHAKRHGWTQQIQVATQQSECNHPRCNQCLNHSLQY